MKKKDPPLAGGESNTQLIIHSECSIPNSNWQALDIDARNVECTDETKSYYDVNTKEFLIWNGSQWIPQTESQFKRRLRNDGFSTKPTDGSLMSAADNEILRIQNNCAIAFAGSLAGYRAGITQINGHRILVTVSPLLPTPAKGNFPILHATLLSIIYDCEQPAQLLHFFGWLQCAISSLRNGTLMPGQALVIAGPVGCGKSLLQNLITIMLGGRSAKPYQFMTGATTFNSEMFGAEHLMIEDEAPSTDYRSRKKLGSYIKQLTVNQDQRCHAKGRDALMLRPFWRLSISLNDEPEDLHVLPPLDSGLVDKMIILRAQRRDFPMPTATREQRSKFWDKLISEVPAFLHWLLFDFTIPEDLVSDRFGITHFHHPELVTALHCTSNEAELLSLIDTYLHLPLTGTAAEIDKELRIYAGRQADKLLYFSNAAGTYLARLSKQPGSRVSKLRTSTNNQWRITRA